MTYVSISHSETGGAYDIAAANKNHEEICVDRHQDDCLLMIDRRQ